MLRTIMESNPLRVGLRYSGDYVDDGTMPIEDVVASLQGFAGAYGKTANELLPGSTHELKISAIKDGSFQLTILAWVGAGQLKSAVSTLKDWTESAKYVFGVVRSVIDAKKHVRSKPFEVKVIGDNNTTVIINAEGTQLSIPPEALKILQEKILDSDLARIASPLSEGAIDTAELSATDSDGTLVEGITISSLEKEYFDYEGAQETSKSAELSGLLVSLNKESMRGTFKRNDGVKVPYRYVGGNPDSFCTIFAFKGNVRIGGTAFFDDNLNLRRLEIEHIVRLQGELGLSTGSPS
jgi:hypothetical protein